MSANVNRRPMSREDYLRAAARAMTERQLLDAVLGTPKRPGLALALGYRGYHTHRSEHSPAGFPDLVLVRGGRLVFAELKTERGRLTAEQEAWIEDLSEVELAARDLDPDDPHPLVEAVVWRPSDLLGGYIEATLRGDTPSPGLALPPRTR